MQPSNYGNNRMQAETHAVRASLQEWSAHQESWEIRMWCNIIARHLDLLTREPHNLTLRQQTAAKVEQLRLVAVRVAKLNNCKGARTELAPPLGLLRPRGAELTVRRPPNHPPPSKLCLSRPGGLLEGDEPAGGQLRRLRSLISHTFSYFGAREPRSEPRFQ